MISAFEFVDAVGDLIAAGTAGFLQHRSLVLAQSLREFGGFLHAKIHAEHARRGGGVGGVTGEPDPPVSKASREALFEVDEIPAMTGQGEGGHEAGRAGDDGDFVVFFC